jgi:hypothetical protein
MMPRTCSRNEHDQGDHAHSEKSGNFAHAVQQTDICPIELRDIDNEIIQ